MLDIEKFAQVKLKQFTGKTAVSVKFEQPIFAKTRKTKVKNR